ncbi:hypothetical protein OCF57_04045 [Bacillus cereus]|uniref:hypothetical protein n=1 Tax=Bacillus cereus group TaxID=86661 RepID=UPI001E2BF505|nr:hypothetical protein [Bacillus cereus]MCC2539193.1 hypothetical protein [Bacillus thuringiensis]MCU4778031.1 hypothetical protein [Bacillus cereus]
MKKKPNEEKNETKVIREEKVVKEAYNTDLELSEILQGPELAQTLAEIQNTAYEQIRPVLEVQRKLSEQIQPEIYGLAQTLAEIQNTAYEQIRPVLEAQRKLSEQIQPEIYGLAQTLAEIQNTAYEQIRPVLEAQRKLSEQIQPIIEIYNNINWDSIREAVAEQIKEIEAILIEQEKKFWCLDMDSISDIVDGEITEDGLSEYIDKNIESYIKEIVQDPMYKLHATLIEETYEAYKGGFYKLCIMPLFAAFEHVITLWYMGKIKEDKISVNHKPDVRKLYHKIKPEKYKDDNDVEKEQLNTIFGLSVLRMYKNTFVKIPDKLSQELNRNSIAHGYHDYDSLNKEDVLKLFQLLKSSLILKSFDSKNLAEL